MPRLKIAPKGRKPGVAPPYEALDEVDRLLVRGRPKPGSSVWWLHSAPGFTVLSWQESDAGRAYRREHPLDELDECSHDALGEVIAARKRGVQ